jgi:hypothetical protein
MTMPEPTYTTANGEVVTTPTMGTPGILGAIHDAVKAIARTVAPKSITQRGAKVDAEVAKGDPQSGLGQQFNQ